MRLCLRIICVIVILFSACSGANITYADSPVSVILKSSASEINVGDTVNVAVCVENVRDLAGFTLKLEYDSYLMTVMPTAKGLWQAGQMFAPDSLLEIGNKDDTAQALATYTAMVLSEGQAVNGDGVIAMVRMKAIKEGTCVFRFKNGDGLTLGAWGGIGIPCNSNELRVKIVSPPSTAVEKPTQPTDSVLDSDESSIQEQRQEQDGRVIVTTEITYGNADVNGAVLAGKRNGKPVVLEVPVQALEQQNEEGKPLDHQTKLVLSRWQVRTLAQTGLTIKGSHGTEIELPKELLDAIEQSGTGLEMQVRTMSAEQVQAHVGEKDEVCYAEDIDTNFSGTTRLRFKAPADINAAELMIRVMHSDGTEESIMPTVVTDEDGNTYLEFTVDKFSTFIVYKPAPVVETKRIRLTVGKKDASINGEAYALDAVPFIKSGTGRTLVPVRFVSEALGAEVQWLPATRQVVITDTQEIILTIGLDNVVVDGTHGKIDCAAEITNSRTYVPLRFVSETLGATVEYISASKEIVIER